MGREGRSRLAYLQLALLPAPAATPSPSIATIATVVAVIVVVVTAATAAIADAAGGSGRTCRRGQANTFYAGAGRLAKKRNKVL